jgi:cysteine synthase
MTISITKGWIKMEKAELNSLRNQIYIQYKKNGGSHDFEDFNSHLPNYEELIFIIEKKLNDFQEKEKKRILIDGVWFQNVAPGKTFLKHFYHTKRSENEAQFQRININLCYLFAYEMTREDFFLKQPKENAQKEAISKTYDLKAGQAEFIVSYTSNNLNEARKIENFLQDNFGIKVTSDIRNSPLFRQGELSGMFKSLSGNQYIINIISRDYLQNEECIEGLINYTRNNFEQYRKKSINIILADVSDGEYNIFSTLGKIALSVHWKLHIEKLEKAFSQIIDDNPGLKLNEDITLNSISQKVNHLRTINKEIIDTLQKITNMKSTLRYDIFFEKIKNQEDIIHLIPKVNLESCSELEKIYQAIQVPSNNNPQNPEFPPKPFFTPSFPASKTFKIAIPGFNNVWIKDESTNPTGTHKDRFAWEVVIKYKALLESSRYRQLDKLPQISMISSGGAATAVQNLFNLFDIPISIKVLINSSISNEIRESLTKLGCTLYETDLSAKLLKPEDIKLLTENWDGIDITYRETLDPNLDNYYDWMSYEIINQEPDYCFIPFGTGDLFINILNIVKKEYFNSFLFNPDPRFSGSVEKLKKCCYLGAATQNKNSLLDKLYSSFLPTYSEYIKYINELINYSCVGKCTSIQNIHEEFVFEAVELGKELGLTFEPSGLAGLALFLQLKEQIPHDAKIVIVNTGKTKSAEQLLKENSEIKTCMEKQKKGL